MRLISRFVFLTAVLWTSLAMSSELKLHLDLAQDDYRNFEILQQSVAQQTNVSRIVFEFVDSSDRSRNYIRVAAEDVQKDVYAVNYPNGDFYYLIGDLDNDWSSKDYAKFYSVAKWLSMRGFRTIINVVAFEPDLEEALSNKRTTAILWNSHGRKDGTILDSNKVAIESDIFTKYKTPNLKYVLFANCYGQTSSVLYEIDKVKGLLSEGWEGLTNSDELFKYLFSTTFDEKLEKAFGKKLINKPRIKVKLT